jgi:hypothetical protein
MPLVTSREENLKAQLKIDWQAVQKTFCNDENDIALKSEINKTLKQPANDIWPLPVILIYGKSSHVKNRTVPAQGIEGRMNVFFQQKRATGAI